jgi:predicted nucleotidyltransferase
MRNEKTIIQEFKREIEDLKDLDLKAILLFGSYARGDAEEGSDIDILLIFKNEISSELTGKVRKISNALSLKYDVVISEFLFTEEEFERYNTPFLLNVKRESILI